jgi:hypothetical protein
MVVAKCVITDMKSNSNNKRESRSSTGMRTPDLGMCDFVTFARQRWTGLFPRKAAGAALLALLAMPAQAATTWYVDNAVTGSNKGTSWTNAWTSVGAISGVQPGDTVYFSGGSSGSSRSYPVANWSIARGTPGNPITYQIGQDPSHNGTAIFSSGSTSALFFSASTPPNNVVFLGDAGDGQMHFQLSGFGSIIQGRPDLVNFRCGYVNMGTLNFDSGRDGGGNPIGGVAITLNTANNVEFDHIFCHLTGDPNAWLGTQWSTGGGFNAFKIHHVTLEQANIGIIGCDGILTSGGSCSIYNCTFIGVYDPSYWGSEHADGLQPIGGDYMKIYNNVFLNIPEYAIYFGTWPTTTFNHCWIYNNLIVCSGPSALHNGSGGGFGISSSHNGVCTLTDNIIANNIVADYTTGASGQSFWMNNNVGNAPGSWPGCIVANNVIVNSTGGFAIDTAGHSPPSVVNNVFLTSAQAASLFVRYAVYGGTNNDFHLNPQASALIGQGTNLSAYFGADASDVSRPTAGPWDLGPYTSVIQTNPVLRVSPSSLAFGPVASGHTVTNGVTVRNIGGGILAGMASLPVNSPFKIASGTATYSLAANQSQTIAISYSPSGAGVDSQIAVFTGGNGATATVSGSLMAVLPGLSFDSYAGTVTVPFTTNGAGYISQATDVSQTGVVSGGRAVYGFNISTAGNYVVSALVNAPNSGCKSFWINIDGEPTDPAMIWDVSPYTSGFESRIVSWRGNGDYTKDQYIPVIFHLAVGVHQLFIVGREANVALGTITIAPYSAVTLPSAPRNVRLVAGQ